MVCQFCPNGSGQVAAWLSALLPRSLWAMHRSGWLVHIWKQHWYKPNTPVNPKALNSKSSYLIRPHFVIQRALWRGCAFRNVPQQGIRDTKWNLNSWSLSSMMERPTFTHITPHDTHDMHEQFTEVWSKKRLVQDMASSSTKQCQKRGFDPYLFALHVAVIGCS